MQDCLAGWLVYQSCRIRQEGAVLPVVLAVAGILFKLTWQLMGSCLNYPELDIHMKNYLYMLGTLGLIHRLLTMLGSSIRALITRVTIQKRALEAPNGLACAPREVCAHLDHACDRRACFVVWTSSG